MEFPLVPSEYRSAWRTYLTVAAISAGFLTLAIIALPAMPTPPESGQPPVSIHLGLSAFLFCIAFCTGLVGAYHGTKLFSGCRSTNPALLRPVSHGRIIARRSFAACVVLIFCVAIVSPFFDPYKQAHPSQVHPDGRYILVEHGREIAVDPSVFHTRMWLWPLWLAAFFTPHALLVGGLIYSITKGHALRLVPPSDGLRPSGCFVTTRPDQDSPSPIASTGVSARSDTPAAPSSG